MSSPQNQPEGTSRADRGFRPNLSQDEFDREFFERVLKRNESNSDVLRRQAELLARQGDHHAALRLDRRLVELHPDDPIIQYNVACSLAMTGNVSEAISALERAIAVGYDDFAHMEADADLDLLRDEPGRSQVAKRHSQRGPQEEKIKGCRHGLLCLIRETEDRGDARDRCFL